MNSRWLRAKPSFPHHWFSGSLRGSEVCNQPSSAPTKHLTQDTTNTSSLKRTDLPPWVLTWWELVRAGNNPGGLRSAFFSCSLTDADELNDPHFWYHSPGCGDSCYLPNRPLFWPRGGVSKTAETHSGCLHVHGAQSLQNVSEYIKWTPFQIKPSASLKMWKTQSLTIQQ